MGLASTPSLCYNVCMKTKTNKTSKLRDFICLVCNKPFQNYLSPADIASGRGKVCSMKCKGILNSQNKKKGNLKKCAICKKDFWCRPSEEKRKKIYCSRDCFNKRDLKSGQRFLSSDGYVIIYVDGRQIKEHRHLMSLHLGRPLKSSEIVHHKDHNKLNNDLSNLEIMTRAEHNRTHFKINYNDGLTNIQRFKARRKGLINY